MSPDFSSDRKKNVRFAQGGVTSEYPNDKEVTYAGKTNGRV